MATSDDAVRAATGRDRGEWEQALDARGGADLPHGEIVALLGEMGVESGWWRQEVAVGYERRKGKRVPGRTAGAGFQIGVRRTIPVGPGEAWRLLTSAEGVRAWLGDARGLRLEKGERYEAADGAAGEVRVVTPGSHLRITRRPPGWARGSTIQVRVMPAAGGRTVVSFHEEHLPGAAERESRRAHFGAALDAIERKLTS